VTPTVLVVIRRDRPDLMPALGHLSADESIHVMTDRRHADRRTASSSGGGSPPHGERRREQRRRGPAEAWETLGFVIVPAAVPER
jgi:hypothetical protein